MNTASTPVPHLVPGLATGSEFIAALPLANPVLAEQKIIEFLDALIANPPDSGVLMSLLEQARVPLCFVEEELAKRYNKRPQPLSDDEDACFRQVVGAWRRMEKAYALCARRQEPAADNPQYAALIATILHRCLYYTGMVILEHFRARRDVPAGIWHELHGYYETAEQWGVTDTPVHDALENGVQATHCAAAYVALLLIEIASPYGCSPRDLNLIRRWAGMWAPLVSLHHLDDDYEVPPYIVELMKDHPIHPTGAAETIGRDARRLDMSRLGLQISHMVSQLHQRLTPSQLGLGEETSGHVIQLLERLSRPWTQSASPRRFRRFASEGIARVAVGLEAIYYFLSGTEFGQPDSGSAYSRNEFEELYTFRDRVTPGQALVIRPEVNYKTENWTVINHSANGFRLGRSHAGQRIAHGQLLAVCPPDGERFLLAQSTWLMQDAAGNLVAGLAVLPGVPTAVAVCSRMAAQGGHGDRFVRAFILSAVPAIREDESLVLPTGTYQPSRLLEIHGEDRQEVVRMKNIRQRGTDFDRVTFEPV